MIKNIFCIQTLKKKHKTKIPFLTKWDFSFMTSTGQISINFMEDLKRLAYCI